MIEALITSSDEERKNLMQKLAIEESNLPVYDTKNGLGDYWKHLKTEVFRCFHIIFPLD